ncbi:MAG: hypothetical protein HUJ26_16950 [Planctomycetaceae bacterium]|nr:hypothetical protein [Planctomycetaceae bacterium]
MFDKIYYGVSHYFTELSYFMDFHIKNMTPQKYSYALIFVLFIGWVMMRNQKR